MSKEQTPEGIEICPTCGGRCTTSWSGLDLVENSGDETLATREYHSISKDLIASLQNAELQRENESLRKQLHEHNGICQEKLSEQLNSVLPEIKLLKEQNAELQIKQRELLDVLQEAALQIDYLHRKFKPTGSGNNVIARIESLIEKYTDKK